MLRAWGMALGEPVGLTSRTGEKERHERLSKNAQALLACQGGWPRAVQSVRRYALDSTLKLNRFKDRNMSSDSG